MDKKNYLNCQLCMWELFNDDWFESEKDSRSRCRAQGEFDCSKVYANKHCKKLFEPVKG